MNNILRFRVTWVDAGLQQSSGLFRRRLSALLYRDALRIVGAEVSAVWV